MSTQQQLIIKKNFTGIKSYANPAYDLYVEPGQAAFGTAVSDIGLRRVMEYMSQPRDVLTLSEITQNCNSDQGKTIEYLKRWQALGLIEPHGTTL